MSGPLAERQRITSKVRVIRSAAAENADGPCDLEIRIGSGLEHVSPSTLLRRDHALLAIVTSESSVGCWGVALTSDYLAVQRGCELGNLEDPLAMAGLVWRAGRAARRVIMQRSLDVDRLLRLGIADAMLERHDDPVEWARSWVGRRSVAALASAAVLLRSRHGGTTLERSEFARLFSTGIPQSGLARFLAKQPLDFSENTDWEMR